MFILSLKNIVYTTLNSKTWCATAQVVSSCLTATYDYHQSSTLLAPFTPLSYPIEIFSRTFFPLSNHINLPLSARQIAQNRRQQQRKGVRLLLQSLVTEIGITDTLNDFKFPYQLSKSGYYVCFSHSGDSDIVSGQPTDKVAVILSAYRAVGIDIETQDIAWHVAQRFYHPDEIEKLLDLTIHQRNIITKWLWQIKESFIKIYQYTLAQGLGISYTETIPKLLNDLNRNYPTDIIISATQTDYQIMILPDQQTVVVF